MSPSTRSEGARTRSTALTTALQACFGVNAAHVADVLAALGATTTISFLSLEESDFNDAAAPDPNKSDKVLKLNRVQVRLCLRISDYIRAHNDPDDPLDVWYSIDADKLEDFIIHGHSRDSMPGIGPTHSGDGTNTTTTLGSHAESEFRKGIKRSIGDYPKLTDDKYWLEFQRTFSAIAGSHGVADVLNPNYVPDAHEYGLFNLQNEFVYSVLLSCLKTSKSKKHVVAHSATKDAQAIFRDLLREYSSGTDAQLSAEDAEDALKDLSLNNKWTLSYAGFFDKWSLLLLDLEKITGSPVSDSDKRKWLTESIRPNVELSGIASSSTVIAQLMPVQLGTSGQTHQLSFDMFYAVLVSHAKIMDKQRPNPNLGKKPNNGGGGGGDKPNRPRNRRKGGKQGNKSPADIAKAIKDIDAQIAKVKLPVDEYRKLNATQQEAKRKELAALNKRRDDLSKSISENPSGYDKSSSSKDGKGGAVFNPTKSTVYIKETTIAPAVEGTEGSPDGAASTSTVEVNKTNVSVPTIDTSSSADTVRRMMSTVANRPTTSPDKKTLVVDGVTYIAKAHRTIYAHPSQTTIRGSLIDGGANAGLSGSDVKVLTETTKTADVIGIDEHTLESVPICTVAGYIESTSGPIIGIFNQYAHTGNGHTVHSVNQLLSFGLEVNERPASFKGGTQSIRTPDGFEIPLYIRSGLAYMDMRPPSEEELDTYPHVIFTSDSDWDPTRLDDANTPNDTSSVYEPYSGIPVQSDPLKIDMIAANSLRIDVSDPDVLADELHQRNVSACVAEIHVDALTIYAPRSILPSKPDFEKLRQYMLFVPTPRVRDTIRYTTQWYQADARIPMRKHYKSRFPGANVPRLNEIIATDPFFSDTPAAADGIPGHAGCVMVQLYTGTQSHFTDVFPMTDESQMERTLKDFIAKHGAPLGLFSDNAKAETSAAVMDILRHYNCGYYRSEPNHQHQNPAERRIQDIKRHVNVTMDRTGTPARYWLLCLEYVVYCYNRISLASNQGLTPYEVAFGQRPDISSMLQFRWFEPVYFMVHDNGFPSESGEALGRFVGIAQHQGDVLTYLVLTEDTNQVITRSSVRTALGSHPNYRALIEAYSPPDGGEVVPDPDVSTNESSNSEPTLRSFADILDPAVNPSEVKLPTFSPEELIGRLFVRTDNNTGTEYGARVIKQVQDWDSDDHQNIKFLVSVGDKEEVISYTLLCDLIEDLRLTE